MKRGLRPRPIAYVRVDDHLVPLPRFMRLFNEQIAVSEEVVLDRVQNRSMASHNHYFAALHEAFKNLAEEYGQEFKDAEHLRHWCLCEAGYCDIDKAIMNTADDAQILRDRMKRENPLRIIRIDGNIATIFYPHSQSRKAMGKDDFEKSKAAVLEIAASMARTTPSELKKNAGRSA